MNPRVKSLKKSSTLAITALTKKLIKEGKDIVNFAAGEPDFDTPDFIKKQAIAAINEGFTKYTPSAGTLELREKIAEKLKTENNIDLSFSNIIVTSGAKYSIFIAMFALLDEGDEVIIPAPFWVSYPEIAKLTGAKVVNLPTSSSNNFKIDPAQLEKAITSRTKALILNYPANPTGTTYSETELKAINDVVTGKGIFVISDEIYETLLYDNRTHTSFASLPGALNHTVTINGFSKAYSMTGWRIGYLAAPVELVAEISKIVDHTTSCSCAISQKAALAALSDTSFKEQAKVEFQKRRDILWQGLSSHKALKPIKSEGTFYMFCDITQTDLSSADFATKLLEEHSVSCIPAQGFGAEGFIRFSFSTLIEQINKGIDRIRDFLNKNKNV